MEDNCVKEIWKEDPDIKLSKALETAEGTCNDSQKLV